MKFLTAALACSAFAEGTIPSNSEDQFQDDSSFSCGLVNGIVTVNATFPPIKSAFPERDQRKFELYRKHFDDDEYKFGMFDETDEKCKKIIDKNKHIDENGYTTFTFALDGPDGIREACQVDFTDITRVENGETVLYQNYQFAIGYENLLADIPGGALALLQPGCHKNLECEIKLSNWVEIDIPVSESDFSLEVCRKQTCAEKYEKREKIELNFGPEMKHPLWYFLEVNSKLPGKYSHISDCKVVPYDLNGTRLDRCFQFLKNGCVSKKFESFYSREFDRNKDFIWVGNAPRAHGTNSDQFGLQVIDIPGAASYQVECNVIGCEYGTSDYQCRLRDDCPVENRYDEIFGRQVRARRANKKIMHTMVKSNLFLHPCQKFGETDQPYLCFPQGSDNCWLRTACEGRYES